jgi:hypothetical protein
MTTSLFPASLPTGHLDDLRQHGDQHLDPS